MALPPHIRAWFGALGNTQFCVSKNELDAALGKVVQVRFRTASGLTGNICGVLHRGSSRYSVNTGDSKVPGIVANKASFVFDAGATKTEVAVYIKP